MEKDYSLLRPFDLEAAKRGEAICIYDGDDRSFLAVNSKGVIVTEDLSCNCIGLWNKSDLRMAPLCWVEGKPVYKGDGPLYHHELDRAGYYEFIVEDFSDGKLGLKSVPAGYMVASPENLTWTPPKVKREVKLLAWFCNTGELRLFDEKALISDDWQRVPSEDKVIVLEE